MTRGSSGSIAAIVALLLGTGTVAGQTVASRLGDGPVRDPAVVTAPGPVQVEPSRPARSPAARAPRPTPSPSPAATKPKPRAPARPAATTAPSPKPEPKPRLPMLRGLGAWIDMYDYGASGAAAAATLADRAAANGVGTIWVQTSRHNTPDIAHPAALGALVDRARHHGLRVIAWTLPEFRAPAADLRKARAAALFRSPAGHRFAALGIDIEVSSGAKPGTRSKRLLTLMKTLDRQVRMPLVAIVPPPAGFARNPAFWPGFPWRDLAATSDAIATMGYWSYRGLAPGSYTAAALRDTKALVGRPSYPVHVIGGLAAETSVRGVRAFCRVAAADGAIGASLYDLTSTPAKLWAPLQGCRSVGR